jgi:hypothetical protein
VNTSVPLNNRLAKQSRVVKKRRREKSLPAAISYCLSRVRFERLRSGDSNVSDPVHGTIGTVADTGHGDLLNAANEIAGSADEQVINYEKGLT